MDKPEIYVACLASYNNGYLHGQWIDANQLQMQLWRQFRPCLMTAPSLTHVTGQSN